MSKRLKAIGLMSGTSMDGIDLALVETDGETYINPGPSRTFVYAEEQRQVLRAAIADAVGISTRTERTGSLAKAEISITDWHAKAVQVFLHEIQLSHSNIDVIGFHGQTVIHRPERQLTVQLGLGQELSNATKIPVVYDMRAADVAAGGQGAPLVPAYHQALAAALPQSPVAFVNIGGVANVTFVGSAGELIAFDTGPGNALLDDWMKRHTGKARDENGNTARKGQIISSVVDAFMAHPFFSTPAPKSLDRNSFAAINVDELSLQDGAATLVEVTARGIAAARQAMPEQPKGWIICGGGRHNVAIMEALARHLEGVVPAEKHGFNGDSMEAEAWAYLAVRSLKNLPLTYPGTTGVGAPQTGGVHANPT